MSNSAASNADVKITNIRKNFKINSETIEVLNNINLKCIVLIDAAWVFVNAKA